MPLEVYLPAVGTGSSTTGAFDAVAHLESLIGRKLDRRLIVERRSRRKQELCGCAPLLPGVPERLAETRRLGLLTAIVTRNRDEWVAGQCERVGLTHGWDVVVCANSTPTTDKSELYRRALVALDVDAVDAAAVEDSPAGVRAARAAGLYCVAVPNDVTRPACFDDADVVCPSLEDLSISGLLQRTGTRID